MLANRKKWATALVLLSGLALAGCSSGTEQTKDLNTQGPLGGNCDAVSLLAVQAEDAMTYMNVDYTKQDVMDVLKKAGDYFVWNFGSDELGQEYDLVLRMGRNLLKTRVNLSMNRDTKDDAQAFYSDYQELGAICSGE